MNFEVGTFKNKGQSVYSNSNMHVEFFLLHILFNVILYPMIQQSMILFSRTVDKIISKCFIIIYSQLF